MSSDISPQASPSLNDRIPLNIVTGSLGSGKTTLLAHLLRDGIDGLRPAVLINELGTVSVDGAILDGLGSEITELASGCLCCMYSDDLRSVVRNALAAKPDLLIIETSGAAYPDPLLYSLLELGLTIDAIITVVDTLNLDTHWLASDTCIAQIQAADVVLLNKIDLAPASRVAAAEARVREVSSTALILHTAQAQVDPHLLFGTAFPRTGQELDEYRRRVAAGIGRHHLEDDNLQSLVLRTSSPVDRKAIRAFIRALPPRVFRVKGILAVADSSNPELLSVVCGRGRLFSGLPRSDRAEIGAVVAIGRGIADDGPTLQAALDRCCANQHTERGE
jgi:G3E family GTPase